ncbi:MAG: TIR domain-containing protein [Chitinophagaceae bacterium]
MSERLLKVFLCHSSGDKPAVRDLYDRLRSVADYISPWLDEENLLPGQRWEDEISAAVRSSDVVLVCLSRESINKSGYVQKEIKVALDVADRQPEGTIFLIPGKLEECPIPNRLSHVQWVNLFEEKGFELLLRALTARAENFGISESGELQKHQHTDNQMEGTTPASLIGYVIAGGDEYIIRRRQAGKVAILDMSGIVTIGEGSVALRNTISNLLKEGKKEILINLAEVRYMDSSGIGTLDAGNKLVKGEGGQLKLLNLTHKITELLLITKLLTDIDVFDDEIQALNKFR